MGDSASYDIKENDIIVAGTDGVWDNMEKDVLISMIID